MHDIPEALHYSGIRKALFILVGEIENITEEVTINRVNTRYNKEFCGL